MNQVDEALRWAYTQLAHSETPQLDAQLLLCHVLQRPRSWLFAHHDAPLYTAHWQQFQTLIQQRSEGQPVAYLLGEQEFYGLTLKITPDVLIPRPETELLVDLALKLSKTPTFSNTKKISLEKKGGDPLRLLDLGTGSGAIALAFKQQRAHWEVFAGEQSAKALAIAKENAKHHHLSIHFRQGSWFTPFTYDKFHLIVSNPPYIAPGDPHLSGTIRYEPDQALVAPQEGLADLFQIIAQAPHHLYSGGWLLLEHGYNQADAVRQCFKAHGFESIRTEQDLAGNPRVSLGQWNN